MEQTLFTQFLLSIWKKFAAFSAHFLGVRIIALVWI